MPEIFLQLWRQRKKYLLLLCSIAIGAVTVCAISLISEIGQQMMDQELDAMGLNGLIVTSTKAVIDKQDAAVIQKQSFVSHQTPLTYEYCTADIHGNLQKVMLWGIDDSVYDTVAIKLLHGRLLNHADSGSAYGMVDAAFAKLLYGRENIVGKEITLRTGSLPITFTVVGVVDTGGGLAGQLMGSTIPCFLYLPMQTLQMYKGENGYNQLLITLNDQISASDAVKQVVSCFTNTTESVEIENMSDRRDQLSGILDIFTMVLSALGVVSLLTSGLSMMTVMLQNVREQTPQIGIKKALGATNAAIGAEYLTQAIILSVVGTLLGCLVSAGLLLLGCTLLHLHPQLTVSHFLLPAIPGMLVGIVFGFYPARKAACCRPAEAIQSL